MSLLQALLFSETQETPPPSFVLTILASLLTGFILTCHRKAPSKWGDRIPPSGSRPSKGKRAPLPSQHPSPRPDGRTRMHPALALSFMCLSLKPRGGGRDIRRPTPVVLAWTAVTQNHAGVVRGHSPTYRRILGPKQRHPPYHE